MKIRILLASVLLLLLSTYNVQKSSNSNFEFNIKKIDIENNKIINDKIIKNKLSFLHETNLFFLNNHFYENFCNLKIWLKFLQLLFCQHPLFP